MIRFFASVLLLLATLPSPAATPVAGKDYEVLPPPATAPAAKSAVSMAYLFSHQCHTCADSQDAMNRWFKTVPTDVVVVKVIASIHYQKSPEPTNETYQTLVNLGLAEKVDPLLYQELARGNGAFKDRAALLAWLAKSGVVVESFDKAASSFRVAMQVRQAQAVLGRILVAKANNIPMMLVDNRYVVPLWNTGELPRQLATIDYLVAKSRAERAAAASGTPATK